jgi:hypothetical protein
VATVDSLYVDPSALARLYFKQEWSRELAAWRYRNPGPISVTHHGRCELVNAISLALFRGDLDADDGPDVFFNLENDFLSRRLTQVDIMWRAALNGAMELSRIYSPKLGTRSLDVLHVSCALELELRNFLTFDERQKALAAAVGLKVIAI